MTKPRNNQSLNPLDDETVTLIAQTQSPFELDSDTKTRLRSRIFKSIENESTVGSEGSVDEFNTDTVKDIFTLRGNSGDWIDLTPKIKVKVLFEDKVAGTQSYLLKAQPGATLPAHDHPIDEECLVLEGDVTIGDIHLHAGDYHFAPKGRRHGAACTDTGALLFLRGAKQIDIPYS